jgi:hypothetical protein
MDSLKKILTYFGFKKKAVVYTAIFGNYDDLKEAPKIRGCDFLCFTDNVDLKSNTWKIIRRKNVFDNAVLDAKLYKILFYKFVGEYEMSLWIDGSMQLKAIDMGYLAEKYLAKNNLAVFKHPERNCVYQEADICVDLQKDKEAVIRKQMDKYKKDNYPCDNGLISGGFILRKNEIDVKNFCDKWWEEVNSFSKRDQLSFNYLAWKYNFNYNIIDDIIWENDLVKVYNHK